MCALILPAANGMADPNAGDKSGAVADEESPGVKRHQGTQPYTDPSDGGAFRCDKSIVAGGISVRPSSIVIADGVWSLLVKAKDLDDAEMLKLRIGSTDHLRVLAVRTTDSTAVLTFRYETAESDTEAFVRFPDGELRQLISLDAHGLTPDRYNEGRIRVRTRYGALRYPPGAEERTLQELEGTDESLLALMYETGCLSVRKHKYMDTEDPSRADTLRFAERGISLDGYSAGFRIYSFHYSPDFSERAMSLIFAPHPAVAYSGVSGKFIQHGTYSPCNLPYHQGQWDCRHGVETLTAHMWSRGGHGQCRPCRRDPHQGRDDGRREAHGKPDSEWKRRAPSILDTADFGRKLPASARSERCPV